jgi:hypothetical protein
MNNKLLIGVLIVIIFVLILIVPYFSKSEAFTNMYKYPNKLISTHVDFINSNSNQYSNIFHLFENIANNVFSLYTDDDTKQITPQIINKAIYDIVYAKFISVLNTANCSQNTQNEECKMYKLVLQYFDNEYDYVRDATQITLPTILQMDLINNDSDIENKLNFTKINAILNKLYNKTIVSNINSYTIIRKELIIKKLVKNVLFNIYFSIYPSSVGGLACPIYTADTCPSVPYQKNPNDENSQTIPVKLKEKYKCSIDKSFPSTMSNLCVNSDNNKYVTQHCEVMNGYGKLMCENTNFRNDDNTISSCKFENLTQRCVNPNVPNGDYLNTSINSDGNYEEKSDLLGEKCHLIYNNDLEEMKKVCESQQTKCEYHEITDENSKKYGVCMAKTKSERPPNFCLELSNIDKEFAESHGCSIIQKPNFFYSTNNPETDTTHLETNLKCHLFDSSNEMIDDGETNAKDKEDAADFAFVKGKDNQRKLCEGLKTDIGESKCQFIEYSKYIPSNHNSKYSTIGMCIPKNSVNLEAELIKDKASCNNDLFWSENNNICLNLDGKCHNFKHKGVCNLYQHCLWQPSDNSHVHNEYEFGYCRDLSSSLQRVEDLMDNIHQTHLQNSVELNVIEDKVSKLVPKFKNIITSN